MRRLARWGLLGAIAGLLCWGLAGCTTLGYWGQSLSGHLQLMHAAKPVEDWLQRPDLDPRLRERLQLSQTLRDYASSQLGLPDNKSYRRYADLQREAAVWNVVAAPPYALTLKTWCYPVLGCAGYRGYFKQEAAQAESASLDAEGWETRVYGVPAYSTLGWSNWLGGDPLLNTFIMQGEGELAAMIFHELSHQVAYAADDTEFNESYASTVELLGARRWLAQAGHEAAARSFELGRQRRAEFLALVMRHRGLIEALYAQDLAPTARAEAKTGAYAALRQDYQQLRDGPWGGWRGYDAWFASVNNASLGVLAAYNGLVPAFERLFEREGRDWARFHAEVKRLAALPRAQRRQALSADD